MRLFTGISLAPNVLEKLGYALAGLRPMAKLNWSPPENLHITTRFIGEWPESGLKELERTLAGIESREPIPIAVARFGFFPNPHHPRVLFAGVEASPQLAALARATDKALEPLGCIREAQEYTPHLTLARIKNENEDIRSLREHIASMTPSDFGNFDATDFHLYLSKRSSAKDAPAGSAYIRLSTYPLMKETHSTI
jgi:2'-5' RNA ligase